MNAFYKIEKIVSFSLSFNSIFSTKQSGFHEKRNSIKHSIIFCIRLFSTKLSILVVTFVYFYRTINFLFAPRTFFYWTFNSCYSFLLLFFLVTLLLSFSLLLSFFVLVTRFYIKALAMEAQSFNKKMHCTKPREVKS